MSINFYYGFNAGYKTRCLMEIEKENLNKGLVVVSNLHNTGETINLPDNSKSVAMLAGTPLMDLIDNTSSTDLLMTESDRFLVTRVLKDGDILILDGIENMLTRQQIYYLMEAIKIVKDQFNSIHIATHSYIPLEIFEDEEYANFYLCNKSLKPEKIDSLNEDVLDEVLGRY